MAARRYGATLNGLLSAVDVFARGVDGARMANDALQRRIERIKEQLDDRELRTRELEQQVEDLTSRLEAQEAAFAAERQFLTDEQDDFLRALLEEHEEQLLAARQEQGLPRSKHEPRDEAAPSSKSDGDTVQELRDTIGSLRAERERARELVQRMRAQRDGAQAELRRVSQAPSNVSEPATIAPSGGAHPTTPAPPPFASSRTPAVSSANEHEAAILQNLGVVRLPRLSPPPAELAGALHIPARPIPPAARRAQVSPAIHSAAGSSLPVGISSVKPGTKSQVIRDTEPELEPSEPGADPQPPQPPGTKPGIGATYRASPPSPPSPSKRD